MQRQTGYLIGFVVIVIAGLGLIAFLLAPKTFSLNRQFESNAFRFRYPDGWTYQIPQPNILFLVSPEITQQQEGATVTIQRSLRLSSEADSIESALSIYLERGPLRSDRAWTIVEGASVTDFNGRYALRVIVQGAEVAGTTEMHSEITITQANNGFFYIFTVTAPLEQWAGWEAAFQAILASVEILE